MQNVGGKLKNHNKMKQIFFIALTCITIISCGQNKAKKSFEDLSTLIIDKLGFDVIVSISYDESISEVINKQYNELDKSDPFYADECDGDYIKLIRTKIDKNSNNYYIISYNPSCCCSYGFTIYKDNSPNEIIGIIHSARLFIPGNGSIYADGRMWSNYNKRQKFIIKEDTIQEIEQPFKYVGLSSKTLKTINIYSDKDLKIQIASIPTDYEIEVLLSDNETKDLYLVRTSFGMVGWTKLIGNQGKSTEVEGIFYWGQ